MNVDIDDAARGFDMELGGWTEAAFPNGVAMPQICPRPGRAWRDVPLGNPVLETFAYVCSVTPGLPWRDVKLHFGESQSGVPQVDVEYLGVAQDIEVDEPDGQLYVERLSEFMRHLWVGVRHGVVQNGFVARIWTHGNAELFCMSKNMVDMQRTLLREGLIQAA